MNLDIIFLLILPICRLGVEERNPTDMTESIFSSKQFVLKLLKNKAFKAK